MTQGKANAKPPTHRRSAPPAASSSKQAAATGSQTAGQAPSPLVVGIGASAGGLEAFRIFFSHMPSETGMAFVLIQHLAPDHKSMLSDLLGRCTAMPVVQAENRMEVAPDTVFVIPPDATLTIGDRRLHVEKPAPAREQRRPIDTFMFSLAEDQGENAVCIILSGSGSDGTLGLATIKEHGGITLAQSQFDAHAMAGMPSSAAATGLVDHVMAVEAMPAKLIEYQHHLARVGPRKALDGTRQDAAEHLGEVRRLLQNHLGHDFSQYRENTLIRRVQRRMQVGQLASVPDYVALLRRDPHELDLLFRDILIGVTRFFRDTAAFDALQTTVIPEVMKAGAATGQIRVWVPGCATGEEAYSIAILLREAAERQQIACKCVIFATDINDVAVAIARGGRYQTAHLDGVSSERRQKWFVEDGDRCYPINEIREMCVFSVHSVLKHPPFSRLDLISCRNLLIYMDTALQERLIQTFHYALRSDGWLFLGPSEGVTKQADHFAAVDKTHRLFRRRSDIAPRMPTYPLAGTTTAGFGEAAAVRDHQVAETAFDRGARRAMEKYSPSYVVIDRHHQIVRFSGPTGKYFEPSDGAASFNLFNLIQKTLRPTARTALTAAAAAQRQVVNEGLPIEVDGKTQAVNLIIEPILQASGEATHYVVAFQDVAFGHPEPANNGPGNGQSPAGTGDAGTQQLENELRATRARLQAAIDESERANEELRSANEEYQSVNEELQSSNEELETSKEEMQSINEELQTVNNELVSKNDVLVRLNADLQNLLESTQIATLFLDDDLRIRNFTPPVTELFHLRDSDRGRPITEIVSRLGYQSIGGDVQQTLQSLSVVEREVYLPQNDATYSMRIRPYRTMAKVVDGVVITFVDITTQKRQQRAEAQLAAIVASSQDAILSKDLDGAITSWNHAAERLYGYTAKEAIGQPVSMLNPAERGNEERDLQERLGRGEPLEHFDTMRRRKDGTLVDISLAVSAIRDTNGRMVGISTIARDNAERKQAEQHRFMLMAELDHRVKNTLATVQSIARQTALNAASLDDFRESFEARLMALSQTHNLLVDGGWKSASLRQILMLELSPFDGDSDARFRIAGEEVRLNPKQALALGLGFHELATNAAKYGAFSVPNGRLEVSWDVRASDNGPTLRLWWVESGGPRVERPRARGFGSRLIERGLSSEMQAAVQLDFHPDGVRCTVHAPLDRTDG